MTSLVDRLESYVKENLIELLREQLVLEETGIWPTTGHFVVLRGYAIKHGLDGLTAGRLIQRMMASSAATMLLRKIDGIS